MRTIQALKEKAAAKAQAQAGRFELATRAVEKLTPYNGNARTHGAEQISQLAASIKEFGFTNPVLIDETNTIIAGEGRVLAAKQLKIKQVPCIVLAGLSEKQKAAYVIADNKIALGAGWNFDALRVELQRLSDLDIDLNLTGFSDSEILKMLDVEKGQADIDAVAAGDAQTPPADVKQAVEGGTQPPVSSAPAPSQTNEPANPPDAGNQADWSGMPEFNQPDNKLFRTLIVHFNDQAAVDAFTQLIGQNITDKTKYLWYPEQVKAAEPEVVYA